MKRKYKIKDWNGKVYRMTATELRDRVLADSQNSNINWIASAEELQRVCSIDGFDEECARDIRIAIINCFGVLLRFSIVDIPNDIENAFEAYNFISRERDERTDSARKEFLRNFVISKIRNCYICYRGDSYFQAREKWIYARVEKMIECGCIQFDNDLASQIQREYRTYIDEGIENGTIIPETIKIKLGFSENCEAILEGKRRKLRELEEVFGEEEPVKNGVEQTDE